MCERSKASIRRSFILTSKLHFRKLVQQVVLEFEVCSKRGLNLITSTEDDICNNVKLYFARSMI